jgi:hypothetical protein
MVPYGRNNEQAQVAEKTKITPGMSVSVIPLRDKGRRITKRQMQESVPLVGRLTVEYQGANQFTTYRSSAKSRGSAENDAAPVCAPLFDHVLEKLDSTGMVLSGYEIQVCDGEPVQYVQAWLVRPLTVAQG